MVPLDWSCDEFHGANSALAWSCDNFGGANGALGSGAVMDIMISQGC